MNTIVKQIQDLKAQRQAWEELFASEIAAIDAQLEAIRAALDEGVRSRESEDSSQESGVGRTMPGVARLFPSVSCLLTTVFLLVIVPALLYGMYVLVQQDFRQWMPDRLTPDRNASLVVLTMTQEEYELCRSAARLVVNDIGSFDSVDTALTALYAEMPSSVRDAVIDRLGGVRNLADLPGALENVLGQVVRIQESEVSSQEKDVGRSPATTCPLSLWERAGVRGVWSAITPHPSPLPEGEGVMVGVAAIFF